MLALVLVLLVVGGLILAPLLGLMSTGLMAGQVYEKKTDELYAADAGVEDAMWRIKNGTIPSGSWVDDARSGWQVYGYPKPLTVGNKTVRVVVYRKDWDWTCGENFTYQILSTAVTDDGGGTAAIRSSTTIESYVDAKIVVRNLLDNAITSQGTIDLGNPQTIVDGDIQWDGSPLEGQGEVSGNRTPERYEIWPDSTVLSNYYKAKAQPENATDPGESIHINQLNPKTIGPSYRHGDLDIYNQGGPQTLTLQGTVYVEGDLKFHEPGNAAAYTIDLGNHTIFVTGHIEFPPAGGQSNVDIKGSGCIIAIGYIDFWPSISGSSTDFVFVMSIGSYVDFKPNGDFYGSLAGDLRVDLGSGCHITWTPWEGSGIDFPVNDYAYASQIVETLTIRTWEINPQ